jgi:hypothetical protein
MTFALGVSAASAPGAPAMASANDISIQVGIGTAGTIFVDRKQTPPDFHISIIVGGAASEPIVMRTALPEGLHWGIPGPAAAEGCTGATQIVCTGTLESTPGGTYAFWSWEVVADHPGLYEITATVEASEPDPDLSSNTYTFRFEVVRPTSPGGGGAAVVASAVKLSPIHALAGAAVTATVRVTAGGTPIRPRLVSCAGSFGKGTPRARIGAATCVYHTPKNAHGTTLRGTVGLTAKGKRITRRFSARLR